MTQTDRTICREWLTSQAVEDRLILMLSYHDGLYDAEIGEVLNRPAYEVAERRMVLKLQMDKHLREHQIEQH